MTDYEALKKIRKAIDNFSKRWPLGLPNPVGFTFWTSPPEEVDIKYIEYVENFKNSPKPYCRQEGGAPATIFGQKAKCWISIPESLKKECK